MKKTLTFLAGLLLLSHVSYACDYPARAKMVNGTTATKEEMLAAQKEVKAYMAAMNQYLDCIAEEEKTTLESMPEASEEELQQRSEMLTKKHNAAVEEMEIVAADFNEQVRFYKAQSN